MLAIGFEKFGSEEQLVADPIKHLFDVYVKINAAIKEDESINDLARAYFKRMEDGIFLSLSLAIFYKIIYLDYLNYIFYFFLLPRLSLTLWL